MLFFFEKKLAFLGIFFWRPIRAINMDFGGQVDIVDIILLDQLWCNRTEKIEALLEFKFSGIHSDYKSFFSVYYSFVWS